MIAAFGVGPLSHQLVAVALREHWSWRVSVVKLMAFTVVAGAPALGAYVPRGVT